MCNTGVSCIPILPFFQMKTRPAFSPLCALLGAAAALAVGAIVSTSYLSAQLAGRMMQPGGPDGGQMMMMQPGGPDGGQMMMQPGGPDGGRMMMQPGGAGGGMPLVVCGDGPCEGSGQRAFDCGEKSCPDGTSYRLCDDAGNPINYFADPCSGRVEREAGKAARTGPGYGSGGRSEALDRYVQEILRHPAGFWNEWDIVSKKLAELGTDSGEIQKIKGIVDQQVRMEAEGAERGEEGAPAPGGWTGDGLPFIAEPPVGVASPFAEGQPGYGPPPHAQGEPPPFMMEGAGPAEPPVIRTGPPPRPGGGQAGMSMGPMQRPNLAMIIGEALQRVGEIAQFTEGDARVYVDESIRFLSDLLVRHGSGENLPDEEFRKVAEAIRGNLQGLKSVAEASGGFPGAHASPDSASPPRAWEPQEMMREFDGILSGKIPRLFGILRGAGIGISPEAEERYAQARAAFENAKAACGSDEAVCREEMQNVLRPLQDMRATMEGTMAALDPAVISQIEAMFAEE